MFIRHNLRYAVALMLGFMLGSMVAPVADAQSALPLPPYRPGAVLVGLRPGVASVEDLRVAGFDAQASIAGLNVVSVAAPVGQEAAVARELAQQPGVAYAELDYRARSGAVAQVIPNDPEYPKQWALPRIDAPAAWAITTGSPGVVIAIVDSGVDLEHPDLAGRVWTNAGEVANNGRDDDGNGYVDDAQGWRFYHSWTGEQYAPRGDGLVADDNGHGTHVAGIAGASANNELGVAGVAWTSPLMIVKVLDKTGYAWYSDVAAGILYAANNGASVINLSLGSPEMSQVLCEAVAVAAGRGKVVVAAAGNTDNTVYYPAACPGALAVGATGQDDAAADFTNPGAAVDLAAPGVDILSTSYDPHLDESDYAMLSGTSEAAPHVAAAAALVWARWPALNANGVKAQLQGTVTDVGAPGRDDETGWGRLDLGRALAAPAQPVDLRLSIDARPAQVIAGNPLTATFTVSNAGAAAAASVTLTARLPAAPSFNGYRVTGEGCVRSDDQLRCGATQLAPGERLTVTVAMTPTVVDAGLVITSASVAAAQRELTPADNRQSVTTLIRAALSGRVFLDANGDGIRQPWEMRGAPGAWLLLEQAGQPVAFAAAEGPGGAFRFDTLSAGSYSLVAQLPEGYRPTTPARVDLVIAPERAQVVEFGAWTGEALPAPGLLYLPFAAR